MLAREFGKSNGLTSKAVTCTHFLIKEEKSEKNLISLRMPRISVRLTSYLRNGNSLLNKIIRSDLSRVFITVLHIADNVAYEWKHGKGLLVFEKELIESDLHGYYDKKLLEYYPKPKEYQYIDDYPFEDSHPTYSQFSTHELDHVDENYKLENSKNAKTPEDFQKEIEELNRKFNNPQAGNVWQEHKL
jgi:hypothetical protein